MISQYFEAPVRRVARRTAEPHFDSLFTSRNEVRRLRAQVKNCRKNPSETILEHVARQISCERRLCQDWRPQNGPQELSTPETLRRTLGAHLGALGGTLKSCRGPLGALGALLGRSWRALGTSWNRLGIVLRAIGPYKMLYARFSSFQNRFGIPQELILATPRMDLGGSKQGVSQPTCICVNLHMRMHIIPNNSKLTLAMPYIPKFAVILSSLCSVIPAQGRRSREASSIITSAH